MTSRPPLRPPPARDSNGKSGNISIQTLQQLWDVPWWGPGDREDRAEILGVLGLQRKQSFWSSASGSRWRKGLGTQIPGSEGWDGAPDS